MQITDHLHPTSGVVCTYTLRVGYKHTKCLIKMIHLYELEKHLLERLLIGAVYFLTIKSNDIKLI